MPEVDSSSYPKLCSTENLKRTRKRKPSVQGSFLDMVDEEDEERVLTFLRAASSEGSMAAKKGAGQVRSEP